MTLSRTGSRAESASTKARRARRPSIGSGHAIRLAASRASASQTASRSRRSFRGLTVEGVERPGELDRLLAISEPSRRIRPRRPRPPPARRATTAAISRSRAECPRFRAISTAPTTIRIAATRPSAAQTQPLAERRPPRRPPARAGQERNLDEGAALGAPWTCRPGVELRVPTTDPHSGQANEPTILRRPGRIGETAVGAYSAPRRGIALPYDVRGADLFGIGT